MQKSIKVADFEINNNLPFTLIAGPCQLESREHALQIAEDIHKITSNLGINFIFKSSFDKANRTSIEGKRGIGLEQSLPIFQEIKQTIGCPILTDVHTPEQCNIISDVVDILQIPAFLCRQTDLIVAAANTDKIVNVKKGQFLAPWDVYGIVDKIESTGNNNIMLTERGVSFGYNRLVNDMRSLPIMATTGHPVVFDATHSVQEPAALGGASGGKREFISHLARAAVAVGVSTLFIETHPDPDNAPSDGPCMLPLNELRGLLTKLQQIDKVIKSDA